MKDEPTENNHPEAAQDSEPVDDGFLQVQPVVEEEKKEKKQPRKRVSTQNTV